MYATRRCTHGVPTVYPYPLYPWLTEPEGRRVRDLTGTGTGQPGIIRGLPVLIPNPFDRALLATIRDKGLCPFPRCLIPKSKLDQTGTKRDSKFRLQNNRTYLFDRVLIARNAIYGSAAATAGAVVNRLLKATSSVPTLVSQVP